MEEVLQPIFQDVEKVYLTFDGEEKEYFLKVVCKDKYNQQGYCEPKFHIITQFDEIELEMLRTALSIYDSDMCKPEHHTREKLNALRDKIEILSEKESKK